MKRSESKSKMAIHTSPYKILKYRPNDKPNGITTGRDSMRTVLSIMKRYKVQDAPLPYFYILV